MTAVDRPLPGNMETDGRFSSGPDERWPEGGGPVPRGEIRGGPFWSPTGRPRLAGDGQTEGALDPGSPLELGPKGPRDPGVRLVSRERTALGSPAGLGAVRTAAERGYGEVPLAGRLQGYAFRHLRGPRSGEPELGRERRRKDRRRRWIGVAPASIVAARRIGRGSRDADRDVPHHPHFMGSPAETAFRALVPRGLGCNLGWARGRFWASGANRGIRRAGHRTGTRGAGRLRRLVGVAHRGKMGKSGSRTPPG